MADVRCEVCGVGRGVEGKEGRGERGIYMERGGGPEMTAILHAPCSS